MTCAHARAAARRGGGEGGDAAGEARAAARVGRREPGGGGAAGLRDHLVVERHHRLRVRLEELEERGQPDAPHLDRL